MAFGVLVVVGVVGCSEVDATDTQSTAVEQIPVGEGGGVESQGQGAELVDWETVVVTVVVVLVV